MNHAHEDDGREGERSQGSLTLTIWVDADSAPRDIRPLLLRRAVAHREYEGVVVDVRFVAVRAPADIPNSLLTLVDPGEGAADHEIEARSSPSDIVVTRDIPFAERIIAKGGHAINDRGEIFSSENIAQRRSLRDAMASLRELGIAPASPKGSHRDALDTKRFADGLERLVVRAVREKKRLR